MSNNFKFVLNRAGVRELMQSEAMQGLVSNKASRMREACGAGFETNTRVGKTRASAMVWADTVQAKRKNLKHNTLLKAMKS